MSNAQKEANKRYYEKTYRAKRKARSDKEKLNKFLEFVEYYNNTYNSKIEVKIN